MYIRQRAIAIMVTAALASIVHPVRADEATDLTTAIQTMDASATNTGSNVVTGKIAADFESFAGSKENATALVTGLRNGSEITLTQEGEPSVMFTPATRPMGFGNVSTSLSLAKYQLAQQSIAEPTPAQLETALNGGTITVDGNTVEYQGILQMRADGMGWGQIAQQLDTKLGFVVSGIKAQNASISTMSASAGGTATSRPSASSAAVSSLRSGAGKSYSANNGNHGIVTAVGSGPPGLAKAHGRGTVTTATGTESPPGRGIVSATGQPVGAGAQGLGLARGHGVVTATGVPGGGSARGGAGNGKALGHFK